MAAVLVVRADGGAESLERGGALGDRGRRDARQIEVSVRTCSHAAKSAGVRVHRRAGLRDGRRRGARRDSGHDADPDAGRPRRRAGRARRLERLVNEADRLDLVDPETLRERSGRLSRPAGRRAAAGGARPRASSGSPTPSWSGASCALVRAGGLPVPLTRDAAQRLRGRLLLARPRPRRRDRRPALPPHAGPAGAGPGARPGAHRRRADPAALHPRAGRSSRRVVATLRAVVRRLEAAGAA